MNVSVVICAYTMDRWHSLDRAVRSCLDQSSTPLEVIVVIDYNPELFKLANSKLEECRVIENDLTKGLSGARNTGVLASSGDVIAFLDDDAFAEPEWLEKLVESMLDASVAGTGGWIEPYWEAADAKWFPKSFYWILGCSYLGLPSDGAPIRNPIGASMAIRRDVFAAVGGFSAGLGRIGVTPLGCEETELCIRYSTRFPDARFLFARDAVVHHLVPASRLTWRYFRSRCWSEGLSKAGVAALVGADSGLAAERSHVLHALPRELAESFRTFIRQPRASSVRISLILVGTGFATLGFLRGRLALRRHTLVTSTDDQALFLRALGVDLVEHSAPDQSDTETEDARAARALADRAVTPARRKLSSWTPVMLSQVDLDVETDETAVTGAVGQRVWVEALRDGQVVGVLETQVENGELTKQFLHDLRSTFMDSSSWSRSIVPLDQLPKASVVVPTICRDRENLVRVVDSLLKMDYPEFEVIIVDNRVEPNAEPLPEFCGGGQVRTVRETKRGVSAARNRGVAVATGAFIAFTDDDVMVEGGWLSAMGTRFALSPEVEAIGGLVLPRELRTPSQLWFEEFYGGFTRSFRLELMSQEAGRDGDAMFPYAPGVFGAGCNMAVRQSTFANRGGFDETLGLGTPARGGEDVKIFMNIVLGGGTVAFEPAALVRHTHRTTERAFLQQVFGYGVGLTALYTELTLREPRHVAEIVRRLPGALRLLTKRRTLRSPSANPSYPLRTYAFQLLGMAYGPLAYLRSAAASKRST